MAIGNFSWLLVERIITMLLSLIMNVYLARHLDMSLYGQYGMVLAATTISVSVFSFGMNSILTKEFSDKNSKYVFANAIFVRFVCAIFLSFMVLPLFLYKYEEVNYCYIAVLAISPLLSLLVGEYYFEYQVKSKYVVAIRFGSFLLFFFVKLLILKYEYMTKHVVFLIPLELAIYSLLLGFFSTKLIGVPSFKLVNLNYIINLIKNSWWLMFSGLASIIYLKVDVLMLGFLKGEKEVAIYMVASRFSEVWFFIPAIVMSTLFPKMIFLKKSSESEYDRFISIWLCRLALVALSISIATVFLSKHMIIVAFGGSFKDSIIILQIHVWCGVFVFMRALVSKWLIIESLNKYSLYSHGLGAIINVALNIILIPTYGSLGAAVATVISYIFSGYLIFPFFKDTKYIFKKMNGIFSLNLLWR